MLTCDCILLTQVNHTSSSEASGCSGHGVRFFPLLSVCLSVCVFGATVSGKEAQLTELSFCSLLYSFRLAQVLIACVSASPDSVPDVKSICSSAVCVFVSLSVRPLSFRSGLAVALCSTSIKPKHQMLGSANLDTVLQLSICHALFCTFF